MCNSSRAQTAQHTEEERKRTIISLQGGKSFGRATTNDVIFLDGTEHVELEPQFISRCHARVHHTNQDGVEEYLVEDISENGTYINDRRLSKDKREILKSGDTIKFGHKNGSQHVADQKYDHPDADFAFCVEMSTAGEPAYQLVEQIRDSRVKVFAGTACAKDIGPREPSTTNKVLQQEADSTNGGPEMENNRASSASSATPEDTQMPSTSQYFCSIPKKTPFRKEFDSPLHNYIYRTSRHSPLYRKKLAEQAQRMAVKNGTFVNDSGVIELLSHLLDINVAYENLVTKNEKLEIIGTFCEKNKGSFKVDELSRRKEELAVMMEEEEPQTIEIRELLVSLSEKAQDVQSNDFTISASSAFTVISTSGVLCPTASLANESEDSYIQHLKSINISSEKSRKIADELKTVRNSEVAPIENKPLSPEMMVVLHRLVKAKEHNNKVAHVYTGNYASTVSRVMEMVPITSQVAVITTAGTPKHTSKGSAETAPMEVDDERHSASSGSTENNYRRRTDSEESEILDVVGTDEPDKDEKGGTETETPTPSPEDHGRQTQNKIDKNVRMSSTPRIDAQSTPSAVVSALPTPMNSPLPRVTSSKSAQDVSTPSSTPNPVSRSPDPVALVKDSVSSESTVSGIVSLEKIGSPAAQSVASVLPSVSNTTSSTSASLTTSSVAEEEETSSKENTDQKRAVDDSSDESARLVKQIKALSATPSSTPAESSKRKQKDTSSRKMKQLDESSADSDSEDDGRSGDKSTKRRDKARRSTRIGKSTPAKKVGKKEKVVEDEDETDDVQEEEKVTPRGGRRKNMKRTASQSAIKERKTKDKDVEPEEAPKKKRGRKKATPTEEEEPPKTEPSKERCGVAKGHCISAKYEKRKNLQWVSCSICNQWFHVWCVRLDNVCYREDETFLCCGSHPSKEAKDALAGRVYARYQAMPNKKPIPQASEA